MLQQDESDEMLSRGFKDQIYDVYRHLPPELQVPLSLSYLASFKSVLFFVISALLILSETPNMESPITVVKFLGTTSLCFLLFSYLILKFMN